MKTLKTVAKLLFVVGALVYLVGLWILPPIAKVEKAIFFGVLMTATFGNYAYLRAEKLGQLDNFYPYLPVSCVNHYRSLVYRCFKMHLSMLMKW